MREFKVALIGGILASGVFIYFSFAGLSEVALVSPETFHRSPEIGISETSPRGEEGGYAIPASGSSGGVAECSVWVSPASVVAGQQSQAFHSAPQNPMYLTLNSTWLNARANGAWIPEIAGLAPGTHKMKAENNAYIGEQCTSWQYGSCDKFGCTPDVCLAYQPIYENYWCESYFNVVPPPPTNMTTSCNAAGTQLTYSWTAPAGYTTFFTRAMDVALGSPAGNTQWDDNFVGTSKTINITPGTLYDVWVHTKHVPTGLWSTQIFLNGLSCPGRADLTSNSIAKSGGGSTLTVGVSATFTANVANGGTAATGVGFTDQFFSGSSATGPWTQINPNIAVGALAIGASAGDTSGSYTPAAAGTIYIRHCTDTANAITEVDEANNCSVSAPFTVSLPPPDLTSNTVAKSGGGTTLTVGVAATFTANVTNTAGVSGTGVGFSDRFSYGGSATGPWTMINPDVPKGALASGASSGDTSGSYNPLAPGNLYIQHCADIGGAVAESNEGNNCSVSGLFTVNAAPTPNLNAVSITPAAGPYTQGVPISISGVVTNNGTANVSSAFTDNFTYQWGGTGGAWLPVNTDTNASLNMGVSVTDGPVSFTPAQSGTLYLQYCIDSTGAITESNETAGDNCKVTAALTVNAASCTGAIPSNGTLCAGDDTGLAVNTPRTSVSACTATKCEYSCNAGYELSGGVCVARNLTSNLDPLTLASGVLAQGQSVTFNGRVQNSGSVNVTTAFTDNFTYCWGVACAPSLPIGGHIGPKSVPMGINTTQNDVSSALLIGQSGTLRVQHCIDSQGQVAESDETVGDNCTITDFAVGAVCTGTDPTNAALCAGDDTGLAVNTAKTSVNSCTAPTKCEFACASGYEVSGGVCVSRNLSSDLTPTVNGSLNQGQNVTFNGRVRNSGSVSVITAFTDNFTYCWGVACAPSLPIGGHIGPKSVPMAITTTQNDVSSPALLLDQAGTLRVQHCIDSQSEVAESDETVGDNCRIADFVIAGAVCTGADPANATLCANDSTGLLSDTPKTSVNACTVPVKCEYACSSDYQLLAGVCTAPNLISNLNPLTVNGTLTEGQTVTFNGRVRNNGGVTITTPFTDNFTYCWGVGCSPSVMIGGAGAHISKTVPMNAATAQNDTSASLLLNQGGTLRVQHCIDSGGDVVESNETIAENCKTTNFSVVGNTATLEAHVIGSSDPWSSGSLAINPGDQIELEWTSNAPNCSGSNFSTGVGSPANSNTQTVTEPTAGNSIIYGVLCGGANVTVEVTMNGSAGPPTIDADPSRVVQGNTTTVTGDTNGNTGCEITGRNIDPGDIDNQIPPDANTLVLPFGQTSYTYTTGVITGETTYTITCDGGVSGTDTVRLVPAPKPI